MATQARFQWSDRYLLGYGPMDDTHKEFVSLVDALQTVEEAEILHALDAFAAHAREHFDHEREWMARTDSPAMECHVEEHENVMESLAQVRELVRQGNVSVVRDFAQALREWFPGHADYMDASLAQWMVRKSSGGVPIVVRRKDASEEI